MALATTRQTAADELFPCDHRCDDGGDAFINVGLYGEGYEQCIICGEVRCTADQDDEYPPARYGL